MTKMVKIRLLSGKGQDYDSDRELLDNIHGPKPVILSKPNKMTKAETLEEHEKECDMCQALYPKDKQK